MQIHKEIEKNEIRILSMKRLKLYIIFILFNIIIKFIITI